MQGLAGQDGAQGLKGDTGPQGLQGTDGKDGKDGQDAILDSQTILDLMPKSKREIIYLDADCTLNPIDIKDRVLFQCQIEAMTVRLPYLTDEFIGIELTIRAHHTVTIGINVDVLCKPGVQYPGIDLLNLYRPGSTITFVYAGSGIYLNIN